VGAPVTGHVDLHVVLGAFRKFKNFKRIHVKFFEEAVEIEEAVVYRVEEEGEGVNGVLAGNFRNFGPFGIFGSLGIFLGDSDDVDRIDVLEKFRVPE
jgi:hypothetical protein